MKDFSIKIQTDLTDAERIIAEYHAKDFVIKTFKSYGKFPLTKSGGRRSYLRRGRFGKLLEANLVFRRISRNKRIFGIVRANTLLDKNTNEPIDIPTICPCYHHLGQLKVTWREKPEMAYWFRLTTSFK